MRNGGHVTYGHDVHDVQAPRDDGVDVIIRYEDKVGNERVAALQIKSEDEFRKWEAKTLRLPEKLKAQWAAAVNNVAVDDYYILLCVDAVRHQKRIRLLCSELKTYRPCEIIEPTALLDLYEMSGVELWTRVTRLLCQSDKVLIEARAEMDQEEPDMAYFLIALTCQALSAHYGVSDVDLMEIWSGWAEFAGDHAGSDQRVPEILGELINAGVLDDDEGQYTVMVRALPTALCALYFDLRVRASDSGGAMQDQLLTLMELGDRIGPEVEEDEDED